MLTSHVLILNRNYQPVHIASAKRALVMLYIGAARALDKEYQLFDFGSWSEITASLNDDTVGLSNRRIMVPRILVLQTYERVPLGRIRFSRQNVFLRDRNTCQYCHRKFERKDLNIDHVIPRSKGGKTNWRNVVASCFKCNFKKAAKSPEQVGMKLLRAPKKPRWSELAHPPRFRALYSEWLPFINPLDASYWNTELDSD